MEDSELSNLIWPEDSKQETNVSVTEQDIVLALHLTDEDVERLRSPQGFRCERDPGADTIARFCARHKPQPIPYSWPFVSVTVYWASEDPRKGAASVFANNPQNTSISPGYTALLKKKIILPELQVVCVNDFRTTALNAGKKEEAGATINAYRRQFTRLCDLTPEMRIAALYNARHRADDGQYPDARIHRHLFFEKDVCRLLRN